MITFLKKILIVVILITILSVSFYNISGLFETKQVMALDLSPEEIAAVGGGEGDYLEWNCGTGGVGPGLFGSCVPIEVEADVNRGIRNVLKNFWTGALYGMETALGNWLTSKINSKLKIRDYYGYNRSVSDVVYRTRAIFESSGNPKSRYATDYFYDKVINGGGVYEQIKPYLLDPAKSARKAAFGNTTGEPDPSSPNFYLQLAMSGAMGASEDDWYHLYSDKALQVRSEASTAGALEILSSEGYKGTREKQDLDDLTQLRTPDFFGNDSKSASPKIGQIQGGGTAAAKAVHVAMQRILTRDYQDANVIQAAAAEFLAWITMTTLNGGGIFGGETFAIGNKLLGEILYKDSNAREDTRGEEGTEGSPPQDPGGEQDSDLDGIPDDEETAAGKYDACIPDVNHPNCNLNLPPDPNSP